MSQESPKRLHLGCGRTRLDGWINLDCAELDSVDLVADLDDCQNTPLPFPENSIDEFFASHLIEHLKNPLWMMQELHRIAKPGAKATFRLPYGSTDDAFEDPTHVRQYFLSSFGYFSQPFYWRADYGYRGDWQPDKFTLIVPGSRYSGKSPEAIMVEVNALRNVVQEMIVEVHAVKPIRAPLRELQVPPHIEFLLSDM